MRTRALIVTVIAAAAFSCAPSTPTPEPDAGVSEGDAGGNEEDAGALALDAGEVGVDAGEVELDAGGDPSDSGSSFDAGGEDAAGELHNNSAVVSQSVPATVTAGASFQISVTMQNTGTTTWAPAVSQGTYLGSESPRDNVTWGTNRIVMQDGDSAAPGDSYTFVAMVTAPSTAGSYTMQWQMLQDAVEWFGATTPLLTLSVESGLPPPGSTALEIVTYYRDQYGTPMTDEELLACLRSIALALNAEGIDGGPFGVLVKTAGRNCGGYSCDIICSGQDEQQRQWDVLVDHEVSASPTWSEVTTIAVRPCEIL